MEAYPDTVHFKGLNTPRHIEGTAHDLVVIGEIPSDIDGAFFRAVPDPAYPPLRKDDNILSADGAINKIEFRDGRVHYDLKYVRTARFEAERQAGRSLFGLYRNPFTDDPSVQGLDRTAANTTPVFHAGRLLMTKEDGRPYRIDPRDLSTLGSWDYQGKLRSETHTAHSWTDPQTGEMFFFGYEAAGPCTRDIAYCKVDPAGDLAFEKWFEAPYCSFMHDFAMTRTHAIFLVFPSVADLDRLKAGGPHWIHEQDRESWVGIMPREGDPADMLWIEGPRGVHAYHVMNAYTEGDLVHVDMNIANTNMIPFVQEESGIDVEVTGGLVRWTMNLARPGDGVKITEIGQFGELPRIRERDRGVAYDLGWYLSLDPTLSQPLHNGPAGAAFNLIVRACPTSGSASPYFIGEKFPGENLAVNELVHVPSREEGLPGWLMGMIDRDIGPGKYEQELWIWAADDLEAGPVARVLMPFVTREQVHGNWVDRALLDAAR